MHERIMEFEQLLQEMESALIANDVPRVNELCVEQQRCLAELVQAKRDQPELQQALMERIDGIQTQMARNALLIEQGMAIADSLMRTLIYRQDDARGLTAPTSAWSARA